MGTGHPGSNRREWNNITQISIKFSFPPKCVLVTEKWLGVLHHNSILMIFYFNLCSLPSPSASHPPHHRTSHCPSIITIIIGQIVLFVILLGDQSLLLLLMLLLIRLPSHPCALPKLIQTNALPHSPSSCHTLDSSTLPNHPLSI